MRYLFVLCAALLVWVPSPSSAQPKRTTPGLVLATDGRHAACDALAFIHDGTQLLAIGDDKVVRNWIVGESRFSEKKLPPLRWPAFREQRGSIYAMALSPDAEGASIAICGYGWRTGAVFILNRDKNDVEHSLPPSSPHVNWAITWSPSGRHVVFGNDIGEIYVWSLANKGKAVLVAGTKGKEINPIRNRVRRIVFLSNDKDETRFVSVAQDGKLRLGDISKPTAEVKVLDVAFSLPRLFHVAVSADGNQLAATGEWLAGDKMDLYGQVEILDLTAAVKGKAGRKLLKMPVAKDVQHMPHCLAFDPSGARLAVGCREHPTQAEFYRETGGHVFIFDLVNDKRLPTALDTNYRPEALAFRTTTTDSPAEWKNQLATAGGDNHEVRLWNISGVGKLLDTIHSPGACRWGVALAKPDKDGKVAYLAWKDEREKTPTHPNRWGTGDWRVFDLEKKSILTQTPKDFSPVEPIESVKTPGADVAWRVETTTGSAYTWRVVGPGKTSVLLDDREGLYLPHFNNLPRCYTFLPYTDKTGKAPVHLAVGHTWGVSVYECVPGKMKLIRVMIGHEGEVMSVAPSADGGTLVTASRDQTLCGWSLTPWPAQRELGASFDVARDGRRLEVKDVALGSPAWEGHNPLIGGDDENCRLAKGDEIDFIVFTYEKSKFIFDPLDKQEHYAKTFGLLLTGAKTLTAKGAISMLQDTRPNQELLFFKTVNGQDVAKLTTVRQRPLWRFYAERKSVGRDWLMWLVRDYKYDTNSAYADKYVGWQVNNGPDEQPDFFTLEQYRGADDVQKRGVRSGFHQPTKVWALFREGLARPDSVIFPDIMPPEVKLNVVTKPGKNADLVLGLSIRPRDQSAKQRLSRVTNLWVNDCKHPVVLKPNEKGNIGLNLKIPRNELRHGTNTLMLQSYNIEGGRGEASLSVEFDDGIVPTRTLRALCVGINDYSKTTGYPGLSNLNYSRPDAEAMRAVFEQHAGSKLYDKVVVHLIPEANASKKEILKQLAALGKDASPDDWLIVFLAGHGFAELESVGVYKPDSFYFLCADSDRKKPDSHLMAPELYTELAKVRCSKMLILDCCHAGDVMRSPLRDLSREGVPFLMLSSCRADQSALEPAKGKGKNGLFTQCLLECIEDAAKAKGKKRMQPLRASELRNDILRRLPQMLIEFKQDADAQVPEFLPLELSRDPVLCKP